MSHDAIEPRHVTMVIRREVDVVIVVRREVLMDRCVRVIGIGAVPVLWRQNRGKGETWNERQSDDRPAHVP
jgi:predicted CoA-binding protein